jgi:hypothetical protein
MTEKQPKTRSGNDSDEAEADHPENRVSKTTQYVDPTHCWIRCGHTRTNKQDSKIGN